MHFSYLLAIAGSCSAGVAGENSVLSKASKLVSSAHEAISAEAPFKATQTSWPHPTHTYTADFSTDTSFASAVYDKWESWKDNLGKKKSEATASAKAQLTSLPTSVLKVHSTYVTSVAGQSSGFDDDDVVDADEDDEWSDVNEDYEAYRQAALARGVGHFATYSEGYLEHVNRRGLNHDEDIFEGDEDEEKRWLRPKLTRVDKRGLFGAHNNHIPTTSSSKAKTTSSIHSTTTTPAPTPAAVTLLEPPFTNAAIYSECQSRISAHKVVPEECGLYVARRDVEEEDEDEFEKRGLIADLLGLHKKTTSTSSKAKTTSSSIKTTSTTNTPTSTTSSAAPCVSTGGFVATKDLLCPNTCGCWGSGRRLVANICGCNGEPSQEWNDEHGGDWL